MVDYLQIIQTDLYIWLWKEVVLCKDEDSFTEHAVNKCPYEIDSASLAYAIMHVWSQYRGYSFDFANDNAPRLSDS